MRETGIRLRRPKRWADKLRAYRVFVDGDKVGTIRQGEDRFFPLKPGTHEVVLWIDWCRSNRLVVDIAEREEVQMECGGHSPFAVFYYATLGRASYLTLDEADWPELPQTATT